MEPREGFLISVAASKIERQYVNTDTYEILIAPQGFKYIYSIRYG